MNKLYISNASRSLGYGDLTEEKHEAVTHFVSGQDVFISLPTGAGKSFCYALLPFVFDFIRTSDKPDSRLHHSIVMVVSPLKSLMEDQVAKFSSRGMKCASVGSDDLRTKEGILADHYQLIFISPEAMLTDLTWREMFSARVKTRHSRDNDVTAPGIWAQFPRPPFGPCIKWRPEVGWERD